MTFLNDLWKKFKTPPSPTQWDSTDIKLDNPEEILKAYQHNEAEAEQVEQTSKNIEEMRSLAPAASETNLNQRLSKLKEHLGPLEAYETIRQEKWYPNIHCPNCSSNHLKRLPSPEKESRENHRYICLDCVHEFTDGDDLPGDQDIPPLNIWMQCWYLMGCSDSLSYIATILGLDLGTVEYMAEQLRLIFNANAPLSKNLEFEEWEKQSLELRKHLQEDLLKRFELLDANVSTSPKDTSEFRRQQNLRRTLTASTAPPPPKTTGRKRRR